jgi:glycerol-3-phosphate dehydrogenase (NAD(P)+)
VAIATGLSDGLGLGANARSALVTRGLAEITRLAVAKGATPLTLLGLGTGRKQEEIQRDLGQVAEGVVNAKSVHLLTAKLGVEMPICEAVLRILHEGEAPRVAVRALLARETGPEW